MTAIRWHSISNLSNLTLNSSTEHVKGSIQRDQNGGRIRNAENDGIIIPVHKALKLSARKEIGKLSVSNDTKELSKIDPIILVYLLSLEQFFQIDP